jgi:hypothetical protein
VKTYLKWKNAAFVLGGGSFFSLLIAPWSGYYVWNWIGQAVVLGIGAFISVALYDEYERYGQN